MNKRSKRRNQRILLITALYSLLIFSCSMGGTKVSSIEEFENALSQSKPGDTIIFANGTYTDQLFTIDVSGTEKKSITIKAEKPGSVIMTGNSRLRIGGDYIVVDGLYFKDGSLGPQDGGVIEFRRQLPGADDFIHSNNSILKNTVIAYYNNPDRKIDYKWVSIYGTYNTVEYCEIIGKNHSGTSMAVWREDSSPQYHTIRNNKFMYIEDDADGNGAEALRIGTSEFSLSDSFTTVENNYFEQCNGEIEIISNKSGNNIYRGNIFVDNAGMLTLRHGDNCTVDGNFFFGNGYYGTGGIRVIGENHIITNNYVENTYGDDGTFRSAICLTNALENGPINGYYQVKNAYVAGNVLINNRRNFIIGGGASSKLVLPPVDSTIENNIVLANENSLQMVKYYDDPINLVYKNNVMYGSSLGVDVSESSIKIENPELELKNGLYYPHKSTGIEIPCKPISADEVGATWVRKNDVSDDPSFRRRNLFEEEYQKVVTLPWSALVEWSGEKGIIAIGINSEVLYIDSTRYKYDIKDDSLRVKRENGTVKIPKSFIEFQLGSAGETEEEDFITLDEVSSIYDRHVLYNEKGFALIVSDKEMFDLLTIKRTQDKIADLFKVTASSNDGNIPANTLDGLLTTRWSADGDGQWLQYNLYEEKSISSVGMAFYKGNERSTSFEIQISDDGENWTSVLTASGSGKSTKMELFELGNLKASFVRVVGHMNSSNSWNSISEVQFYNSDGVAQMDYVKAKADVYVEDVIEEVIDIQLEGTPILPIDDAFVEIQTPDTVYGVDSDKLRIKAKLDSSIVRISYVKFDLNDIADINSAKFQISGKVSTNNPPNPRMEFDVYGIEDDNWEEESITWNNSPNHKADSTEITGLGETVTHLGSFEMYGPGFVRKYVVDVSEFVKAQKKKDGIVTLMLVDSKIQNTNSDPYSKERSNEADRPYLFIQ